MSTQPPEGSERDPLGPPPERIGPYRILDVLGEGGMGVVYRALQTEPVRRRVAVKVIKPGMDTKQVVARFESERQALAVMDHPGIAKVYGGGVTESGRPYFAMELVKGVPITEYCDTHRLTNEERIRLVIEVCSAVQHAHQKGVIHRDLKPSNILVALQDGRPVTKIIDFGIAKAIGPAPLADRTLVTQVGQMIGTPAYMSPEQAEMTGLDVDTRTDIYSLGMILYELLVGALPLELDAAGESARPLVARHVDLPRPSTRLGSLTDSWESLARQRRSDPQSLRRELKGDLDWIVMQAVDPDRNRRYETANGLAMDLRRFLEHQPVLARPPSARYRLGKFVQRNLTVVSLGGALAILTVAFAVMMAVQARRVAGERDRAAQEARTAQQISDFLVELFAVSDPSEARGRTITALEILERGAERIDEELADEPVIQGRLMDVIGTVYMQLGLYDNAEELLRKALEARREGAGPADTTVALGLSRLAWLYRSQQRLDEAMPLAERAREIFEETVGVEHPRYAGVLQIIGMIERDRGNFPEALATLERSVELRRALLEPGHVDLGWGLYHLGWLAVREGRYHEAREIYEEAVPILEEALPADDPSLAWGYNDMAVVLQRLGEYDEARRMHERVLEIRERTQGPDHPAVAATLHNLATVLHDLGDHEGALEHLRRALSIRERAFGTDHTLVVTTLNALALSLQRLGRYGEARDRYEAALEIAEAAADPSHQELMPVLGNLGYLYRYVGDPDAARPLLERALRLGEQALGPDHVDLRPTLTNLGILESDLRRYDQAVPYLARAYQIHARTYGEDHPQMAEPARMLGRALSAAGATDRGVRLLESALSLVERDPEASATTRAVVQWDLGAVRRALGEVGEADSLQARAVELIRASDGEGSGRYAYWQARYRSARGERAQAVRWLEQAVERGFRDPWVLRDPDLDPIRDHAGYRAVAEEIRREVRLDGG